LYVGATGGCWQQQQWWELDSTSRCFLTGLSMTTASNTSLIIAASPAFVALLNRLLGRELLAPRAGWDRAGLCGNRADRRRRRRAGVWIKRFIGDLLILMGTFCGLPTQSGAPLMRNYSPLRVTTLTTAIGALPLHRAGHAGGGGTAAWIKCRSAAGSDCSTPHFCHRDRLHHLEHGRQEDWRGAHVALQQSDSRLSAPYRGDLSGEAITPLKVVGAAVIFVGLQPRAYRQGGACLDTARVLDRIRQVYAISARGQCLLLHLKQLADAVLSKEQHGIEGATADGSPSAVPWSSTKRPSDVITTFMSTDTFLVHLVVEVENRLCH